MKTQTMKTTDTISDPKLKKQMIEAFAKALDENCADPQNVAELVAFLIAITNLLGDLDQKKSVEVLSHLEVVDTKLISGGDNQIIEMVMAYSKTMIIAKGDRYAVTTTNDIAHKLFSNECFSSFEY